MIILIYEKIMFKFLDGKVTVKVKMDYLLEILYRVLNYNILFLKQPLVSSLSLKLQVHICAL